jgi:hypothetical protein
MVGFILLIVFSILTVIFLLGMCRASYIADEALGYQEWQQEEDKEI